MSKKDMFKDFNGYKEDDKYDQEAARTSVGNELEQALDEMINSIAEAAEGYGEEVAEELAEELAKELAEEQEDESVEPQEAVEEPAVPKEEPVAKDAGQSPPKQPEAVVEPSEDVPVGSVPSRSIFNIAPKGRMTTAQDMKMNRIRVEKPRLYMRQTLRGKK